MIKDNGNNFIKTSELAEASGVRYSTIKYYSEIGILPYQQEDERLVRRYDKPEALKRLKEIQRLKNKRLTIKEIIRYFEKCMPPEKTKLLRLKQRIEALKEKKTPVKTGNKQGR